MSKHWAVFAISFIQLLGSFCYAQNSNDTTTSKYFKLTIDELLNVEVSSSTKNIQSIAEAPNVISVIDQSQIIKYGWLSINEIMSCMPGYSPSQDYDRKTISSRGLFENWNNNHMLMLIDGVPVNDNLYGTAYTWEITPLIFAKSLEVVRGPGSALYGSNATNGVIAINTMDVSDIEGLGYSRIRFGSNATRILDAITGIENEDASIILAFNAFETDGNQYYSFDDTRQPDNSQDYQAIKRKVNDNRASNYIFGKISFKGLLEGLSLQYHEQHWEFDTGHGWLFNIPDQPESMNEYRRIIAATYLSQLSSRVNYEVRMRYQRHGIDWDMRYYPDNTFVTTQNVAETFPYGITEYLKTHADEVFSRAQVNISLSKKSSLVAGIEHMLFLYPGDEAHSSNVNLSETYLPNPGNQFIDIKPWLEYIEDKPINTYSIFSQYISPKFGNKLQGTLGLRYDEQRFKYRDIDNNNALLSKSFSQVSPRIGLIYFVSPNLTIKGLAGQAFRAPTPTEMFGTNTYTLASNIEDVKPEVITTYELATDWRINDLLNLRLNGYLTDFANQFAYSVANANLSTNLYSLTTMGFETEIMLVKDRWSGFFNYSYAHRIDEEILDETIAESDELTWAPKHLGNAGVTYEFRYGYYSISGHYQGEVKRRMSDNNLVTSSFRPETVRPWTEIDIKLAINPYKHIELGLQIKNLFDSRGMLLKNNAYIFDYERPGRQFIADILIKL